MAIRFYNPGNKISEPMRFDHPTNDAKEMNLVSFWHIDAPEKSFFDVPTEISVETPDGEHTVPVKFADRVQTLYRQFGVVRINPKPKNPIQDDDNVALNEKDAREKGERLWRECMIDLVRAHTQQCAEIRSHNNIPMRARGTTAHAFKTLGIEDPANDVVDVLSRKQDTSEVETLKATLAEQQRQINQLLAKAAK